MHSSAVFNSRKRLSFANSHASWCLKKNFFLYKIPFAQYTIHDTNFTNICDLKSFFSSSLYYAELLKIRWQYPVCEMWKMILPPVRRFTEECNILVSVFRLETHSCNNLFIVWKSFVKNCFHVCIYNMLIIYM